VPWIPDIEKHVDAFDVAIDKPRAYHGLDRRRPIGPAQQNVHAACRAYRGLVCLGHPGADRIAANDGVGNARLFQGCRRSLQSLLDLLHRTLHALPQRLTGEVK
jgi:hypothetical protein